MRLIFINRLSSILRDILFFLFSNLLKSAYAMLNSLYKEYKNKVTELYGEEADKKVQEEIVKDHIETSNEVTLFYDVHSDRYFESTIFDVQKAEYFLNRELIMKDYAYLNEWYELLDIDTVEDGYALGWSTCACLEMYLAAMVRLQPYKKNY